MSGVLLAVGVYAILRFKPVVDLAAGPGVHAAPARRARARSRWRWRPPFSGRRPTTSGCSRYSSVEHLGLVCLGLGFGGPWGIAGALLHIANHALAKSVLFLLSGRIRAAYGSAEIPAVRGLLARLPVTGRGFLAAMLALLGLPPFGLFVSEVMIFGAGFAAGQRGRRARRPRAPARRLRRAAPRAPRHALRGADRAARRAARVAAPLPMARRCSLARADRARVAARSRPAPSSQHRGGDRRP